MPLVTLSIYVAHFYDTGPHLLSSYANPMKCFGNNTRLNAALQWRSPLLKKKKISPMRGIEPRPRRWKRRILTTRPHGTVTSHEIAKRPAPKISTLLLQKKSTGPTEIRTRITGFRVLGANHYTMGPSISLTYFLIPMYQRLPRTHSNPLHPLQIHSLSASHYFISSCGRVVKATD